MAIRKNDIGKRVKFISSIDRTTTRFGRLITYGAGHSAVMIEKDGLMPAERFEERSLVETAKLNLAEVQITKTDIGQTFMWNPPAPATSCKVQLIELRVHPSDERITSALVQANGRQFVVWAKHLQKEDDATPALPIWQDISTAPKDRPILLINDKGHMSTCEWRKDIYGLNCWQIASSTTYAQFFGAYMWSELLAPPPKPKPKSPREVAEEKLLAAYNDTINVANNTASMIRKAKQNYIAAQNAYFVEVQKQNGKPANWLIKEGKVYLMIDSPFSHFSSEKLAEWVVKDPAKYAAAAADRMLWLSQQRHYERFKQGNL